MKKLGILFIAFAAFFTSCDDDSITVDNQAPVIDATLSLADINCGPCAGTDLNISVNITENDDLHEIEIFLQQSFMDMAQDYSNVDTTKLYELDIHSHGDTYNLNTTYTIDTAHHSTFYLIVNASDHNENKSSDTSKVHVHM